MRERILHKIGKRPIVPALLASLMLASGTNISATVPTTTILTTPTQITNTTVEESKKMIPPALPNGQQPPMSPDGKTPQGMPNGKVPQGMPPGGPGQTNINSDTFTATKVISQDKANLIKKNYVSTTADQNGLLIKKNSNVKISQLDIEKSGNTTSEDASNFNGQNAGLLALSGSQVEIKDASIMTDAEGSNAVFASGDTTKITATGLNIKTTQNSSRGLDATYNGTIIANDVIINTQGAHSASLATDRGEGTIVVNKGTLKTAGEGSPVIYSTGNITANNVTGTASGSEIACVEGKNSITITDSNISGYKKHGVMLYQSFSGDADTGTAKFTAKDSTLTSHAEGSMFYITNTEAVINLTNTVLNSDNNTLLDASTDHWGTEGSNGGHVTLNANNQKLNGTVTADNISSVQLNLTNNSTYTGSINPSNKKTKINLSLDNSSTWEVSADSYVNEIKDVALNYGNIHSNGHNIYYHTSDTKASTQLLIGGGHLIPIHDNGNN